jgi:hypothetical protein
MTLALRRILLALRANLDVVSFEGSTPVGPALPPAFAFKAEHRQLDALVKSDHTC